MFSEGNIECVQKLLIPSNRVLKEGRSIKDYSFEKRVELWNKIRINQDGYLDENCGHFLKDLDLHFRSCFDASLLALAVIFQENRESFKPAEIFSSKEIEFYKKIMRYDIFEILSVDDIRKKLIQKDAKILDLLKDYYIYMDSWVNEQLEDPDIRLTIRYYLKKKWDGYKEKLNLAVSILVMELDWLKILIATWEHATEKERMVQEELNRQREDLEIKQQEEAARNIEEIKRKAQEEDERKKKEEDEKEKGSRYIKLDEVKQYELNFIGRLEKRLGDTVTFFGKTYRVENIKDIKQVDTSSIVKEIVKEISNPFESDPKKLPVNLSLMGNLTERKLFGKKQRYILKALFCSRVEKYAKKGYDTYPLELGDINPFLEASRKEAKEKGEWALLCLASPTGFEAEVGRHINSEDFHRNFLARYLSVCLVDLETGKQLYNPHDEVAKEFAKLCELETDSEKEENLKLSVRKEIEDGLLLKDYIVLGDIEKILGNEVTVKSAFYEYAEEKGYKVQFVENIGLLMMK